MKETEKLRRLLVLAWDCVGLHERMEEPVHVSAFREHIGMTLP